MSVQSLEDWAPAIVTRFRRELADARAAEPHRVEARVEGRDGIRVLCAIEPMLGDVRSKGGALELVWLKSAAGQDAHRLFLRAWAEDGALVMDRVYGAPAALDV
jgi:hypothetical protein